MNKAFALALTVFCAAAFAAPRGADGSTDQENIHRFRSGPEQASLVELYAAEGDSRSPAASRWLSGFKDDDALWRRYVPVNFHVDFWDDSGWADTFAKPEFGARLRDYVRTWKTGRTYVPALVLNGEEWEGWYRGEAPPDPPNAKPGVLRLERRGDHEWRIAFRPTEHNLEGKNAYVVHVALLGFDARTDVTRGENAGLTLRHDFLALDYKKRPLLRSGNELFAIVKLKKPATWRVQRFGAAAWVTRIGQTAPLQAAGGWIDEP